MRRIRFLCAMLALSFVTQGEILQADGSKDSDQTGNLIRQLGDESFQRTASPPADPDNRRQRFPPHVQFLAAESDDAEIRRRSKRLIQTIATRIARKKLAKFVGTWWQQGSITLRMTIDSEGRMVLPLMLPESAFSSNPIFDVVLEVKDEGVFTDIQLPG